MLHSSKNGFTSVNDHSFVKENSSLYKEFIAEREEIMKLKWLESEKEGHDIGFEKAIMEWVLKYRDGWRAYHHQTK